MIRTTNGGLKRLLLAYLFNRARWRLWLLFGVVLAAYAFNIKLAVLYNDWNGRFFNALQAVDSDGIFRELLYFIGLAAVIILLLVWAGYLKDRLTLALRRDLRKLFKNPCSQAELNKIVPFGFSLQHQKMVFFCHQNSIILLC